MNEETEKGSPWDSLIGELGVEIKPEALERKQPASQEMPTAASERKEVVPPSAAPSDWSGLASSLGIEVPPEEPALPKVDPTTKKSAESRTQLPLEDRKRDDRPPRPERSREDRARSDDQPRADRPRGERSRGGRSRDDRPREDRTREAASREGKSAADKPSEERSRDDSRPPRRSESSRNRSDSRRPEKQTAIDDEIIFEEVLEEPSDQFEDELGETAGDSRETLSVEEKEKQRISGEAARSAFDALFSADAVNWGSAFVSPRTNVESSFLFTEGEEAVFSEDIPDASEGSDVESEVEDEKKERRPRRRRGGRGRGRKRERTEASDEAVIAETSIDDETLQSGDGEDRSAESAEGETTTEKRRRRRRPRGGRSRRSDDSDTTAEADESQVRRRIAAHVGEEGDDDDSGDDMDAEDGDSDGSGRSSHRNLPTWNDAIGVIVEGNLAQRSKAPAKQQGGPTRGRGRGGRRHKKS